MELILELIYEKRKSSVEWRQIICAAILALLLGGMYYYVSAYTEYREENFKEKAMPVMPDTSIGIKTEVGNFVGELVEAEAESKAPEAVPVIPKTVKDEENIPNVFAGDGTEELKEATDKTAAKRRDTASGKTKESAVNMEDDVIENPALPSVGKAEDIGVVKKIEEIIKNPVPVVSREISGFICNDKGYITGYTDPSKFMRDSLIVLPRDYACVGIMKGALKGLEANISEVYIPANIKYIEDGTFEELYNLIFIEVDSGNTEFSSVNGILYSKDGKVLAHPNRIM